MKGISTKEMKMIAELEFAKKYYFTRDDIKQFFDNPTQMRDVIYNLHKKGRIVPLNRNKYFLVPVKAPEGKWTDEPRIVADEMFDGEGYFIGGWGAANYWGLTEQIPMQLDIWTTKRQGKTKLLKKRYVFHRTTAKRIAEKSVIEKIGDHSFRILNKEDARKWVRGRQ